jgi:hypothetical protein
MWEYLKAFLWEDFLENELLETPRRDEGNFEVDIQEIDGRRTEEADNFI